jgi:hypothetical protein
MKQPNRVKAAMRVSRKAYGYSLSFPSPWVIDILGKLDFDYVFIDGEHGPFGLDQLEDLCCTAERYNVTPIARVRTSARQPSCAISIAASWEYWVRTSRRRRKRANWYGHAISARSVSAPSGPTGAPTAVLLMFPRQGTGLEHPEAPCCAIGAASLRRNTIRAAQRVSEPRRGPFAVSKRIGISTQFERHAVRHEATNEVHVARQPVELCYQHGAFRFPGFPECRRQLRPPLKRIGTLARLNFGAL